MICIHHNKDMDGYTSGAIVKYKYPDCKLIGWDYRDEIPNFEQFRGQDVIMIDITFPLKKLVELGLICNLTVIDHHISVKREFDAQEKGFETFVYIYEPNTAACEIGWKYLFPNEPTPFGITLIGRYDTWRQDEGYWKGETLPFKYFMYGNCNNAETFPIWLFDTRDMYNYYYSIGNAVDSGIEIMKYQEIMDESISQKNSFIMYAYGLKAVCINYYPFSSETLKSVWDESFDIMIGFAYVGTKWSVSLRSIGDKTDCSVIAKARGGGGHKNAAGFEVDSFEKIFL